MSRVQSKKNYQLHLFLDKDLKEALAREAKERGVTISELSRQKLRESSQLTRLEIHLEDIIKLLSKNRNLDKAKASKFRMK